MKDLISNVTKLKVSKERLTPADSERGKRSRDEINDEPWIITADRFLANRYDSVLINLVRGASYETAKCDCDCKCDCNDCCDDCDCPTDFG